MELYADEDARGGVLEPEGIVGIKFRREKQLETMARLDPEYAQLRKQLADKTLSHDELSAIKVKATAREQLLLPVYMQVSLQFADLHDRAGRMQAKNVIRQSLLWRESRRFFYWRVRRRVNEEYIMKRMSTSNKNPLTSRARNLDNLAAWTGIPNFAKADREVAMWYEENRKTVHDKVEALKTETVAFDVASLIRGNSQGGLKGVQQVLSMLPVAEREEALRFLQSTK
jgi:acetyl-CoA carboxylase/biotin carboxylase 1